MGGTMKEKTMNPNSVKIRRQFDETSPAESPRRFSIQAIAFIKPLQRLFDGGFLS
jgi:hypothetical protein